MVYEKSCGAVIYTSKHSVNYYLIEHMKDGHFSMCKGHTEYSETEEETAIREIKEETGLSVELNTDFREEISYSPFDGCLKKVVFFLAYTEKWEVIAQPEEVKNLFWMSYESASAKLTFDDDRDVLEKAEKYLKKMLTKDKISANIIKR